MLEEYVILGVTIDNRMTFYNLGKKIANKLNALSRIAPYLNHDQIRLIYNSFLRDSLAVARSWKFFSRPSTHFINKVQEEELRIAYNDFNPGFSKWFISTNNERNVSNK